MGSSLKKMAFFMPESQYGTMCHFTQELANALEILGVECLIYNFKEENIGDILLDVKAQNPDCTCTFNPIRPFKDGSQLSEHLQIPHLTCLVDASLDFLFVLSSPYSIVSCVDEAFVNYMQASHFDRSFFFPHGVSENIEIGREEDKIYDVTMLATCIDYESIRERWKKIYPAHIHDLLMRAVYRTMADAETSYFYALLEEISAAGIQDQSLPIIDLFKELELFVKGIDRVNIVKALKGIDIHIFGANQGEKGWKDYLGNQKNVHIHDSVTFEAAIKIMQQSKITLNSFPFFKNGSHERIFYGLASACAVVTNETVYTQKEFDESEGILFYRPWEAKKINDEVKNLLKNPEKRISCVLRGREKVMAEHTWKNRAQLLKETLPELLESLRFT